jgi:ribosomal protein S18 acetylase RimI-like enzyme
MGGPAYDRDVSSEPSKSVAELVAEAPVSPAPARATETVVAPVSTPEPDTAPQTAPGAPATPAPRGKARKNGHRRRVGRQTREPLPLPHARKPKRGEPRIEVRRMHRRDLNRVWEFLKHAFRDVNLATVEYQRPRSKARFAETYEDESVDQLLFEVAGEIVAYAECAHEIAGGDTWINPRYFEKRDMRPLFVEELAVHPEWHGRGVGAFVLEQLHHLAKVRGLTHLVLEVAENNENALSWYRKRGFRKLDAAIFMAHSVEAEPELLPPRPIEARIEPPAGSAAGEPPRRRGRKKKS